jgi:hypothetical protein
MISMLTNRGPAEVQRLVLHLRLATLELKLATFVSTLERRYRPDQPRAPKGTPTGGQWVDDPSAKPRSSTPRNVALAGNLVLQRVGLGDDRLIRQCIYQDMLGRQYTIELDASEECPNTFRVPPYYGAF